MNFENTIEYARQLDEQDNLKAFREQFYIPIITEQECVYFNGNSLGLQPKVTQEYILDKLEDWANLGVEGHFHGRQPWYTYHELFPPLLSPIVGALPEEIVVMNELTVNLHLMMTTFYRPTTQRYKIICESKAFPSDQYAFESQVLIHGFNPDDAIIEVAPRQGEQLLHTEDIIATIEANKDSVALVLFGGINYYNGQVFDMEAITAAAHKMGAYCGFDLAHAAGNIQLKLHDWGTDFACWCSYKYLNSGPGGIAGAFVHQRHITNKNLPRLAGWWGYDKASRFMMDKGFKPIPTAEGWQLSNPSVINMAAHKASLDIFAAAGMENLLAKSNLLSDYLFYVMEQVNVSAGKKIIEIITPKNARGCQLSFQLKQHTKDIFNALKPHGVISDWREPDVIRLAPVPLYNSFVDVYHFGEILNLLFNNMPKKAE